MKTSPVLYIFVLLFSLQAFSETEPFWKKKSVQEAMLLDRKIFVSATRQENHWSFKGAGIVKVPLEDCFREAMNIERLKKFPERFPFVIFDPATSRLKLQIVFLGNNKDLTLFLQPDSIRHQIHFQIVEGWLLGMQGDLFFSDYQRQQSEIGVIATADRGPAWIPDFIFATLIEAVMHHVSVSLRSDLEKDYKN